MDTASRQKRVRPEDIAPPFGFVQKLGLASIFLAFVAALISTGAEYHRMRQLRLTKQANGGVGSRLEILVRFPYPMERWEKLRVALTKCAALSRGRIHVEFTESATPADLAEVWIKKEGRIVIKRSSIADKKLIDIKTITFKADEPVEVVAKRIWIQTRGLIALYVQRDFDRIKQRFESLAKDRSPLKN